MEEAGPRGPDQAQRAKHLARATGLETGRVVDPETLGRPRVDSSHSLQMRMTATTVLKALLLTHWILSAIMLSSP